MPARAGAASPWLPDAPSPTKAVLGGGELGGGGGGDGGGRGGGEG